VTRWCCVLGLWGVLGGASAAFAEGGAGAVAGESAASAPGGDAGADEEGRGFFIAGRAAYMAGRYDEALERFERSYERSGRPQLLYNIGSAAERADKPKRALEAYRGFLDAEPASELRAEVESRIAALEARVLDEPIAAQPAATAAPAPKKAEPARPDTKPWLGPSLSLAVSGAALATGVVLVVLGYQAKQRVREAPQDSLWDDYSDDTDRATTFPAAGFAVGAVGVAGAVLSSVWLAKARKDVRTGGPVTGLGYVGWRGHF
jgi:tetratricopeptide (TPR) repeat protein